MSSTPVKVFCRNCRTKLDVSDLEPYTRFPCPECGTVLKVPEVFDRYLLEKICGTGGMAKIYRALDTKLARRVAIKILNADADPGRSFFETAKIVAKINHPAIVPVLDCGVFNDREFLVMKFMDQGDLEKQFKAGTLPSVPVLSGYLADIASGLDAAAQKNIVHHDVKPSNILLSSGGDAGLGDFDLADIREPGDQQTPCPEWGSPGYLSPERLYHGGEDSKGDVFSLGVTIYELFSGKLPFGIGSDPGELYRRRRDMEFAALGVCVSGLPAWFSELVTSMLAFEPENRPGYPEIISALHRLRSEYRDTPDARSAIPQGLAGWLKNDKVNKG